MIHNKHETPLRKVLIIRMLLVPSLWSSVRWLHENTKPSTWQFQSVLRFYQIPQKCLFAFMSTVCSAD